MSKFTPIPPSTFNLKPSDSAKDLIKDGWFSEKEVMWPGQRFCIEVEEVLLNGKSEFQDILIFQSKTYGIVFILDGVIQVTERDEFSYQEMITHLPMFAQKEPKKVLIIGAGDGGVLREVCKHSCVETIHMCEIDRGVVDVCKHFYPTTLSTNFNDPRLTLMFDDAARYLREEGASQKYDVIIVDSSDPVGPAETLFESQFFSSLNNALAPGGVVCTQGECMWLHLDLIKSIMDRCKAIFPSVKYAYTTIPTYPSGQIGFIISSNDASVDVAVPSRDAGDMDLKYYTTELHSSAFVLPAMANKLLK
jgi:spermidine synthase